MRREKNSFLGRGWQFPPEFPGEGESVAMADEFDDVRQALEALLQTAKYERLMHPEFYCDLQEFVFSSDNDQTRADISNAISRAILHNEPRVDFAGVKFSLDPAQPGVLYLDVEYVVRSTNSRHNMVFPFYLNEATGLNPSSGEAV